MKYSDGVSVRIPAARYRAGPARFFVMGETRAGRQRALDHIGDRKGLPVPVAPKQGLGKRSRNQSTPLVRAAMAEALVAFRYVVAPEDRIGPWPVEIRRRPGEWAISRTEGFRPHRRSPGHGPGQAHPNEQSQDPERSERVTPGHREMALTSPSELEALDQPGRQGETTRCVEPVENNSDTGLIRPPERREQPRSAEQGSRQRKRSCNVPSRRSRPPRATAVPKFAMTTPRGRPPPPPPPPNDQQHHGPDRHCSSR